MNLITTLTILALAERVVCKQCGLLGPAFPPPAGLASDTFFDQVLGNITDSLQNATETSNAQLTDLVANETSYSIGVFDANTTLLSFQHTADARTLANESVKAVDENTVYRVGSISKLFTAYTILVEVGHAYWHRPITDFVPELAEAAVACNSTVDPLKCTDWSGITLGALASHQAGIARGHPPVPAAAQLGGALPESFGLPSQAPNPFTLCQDTPCAREDALRAFLEEPPQYLPFSNPIYSNAGFQLLGYALENITARNFSDLITNDVFCKLGLDNSSYALSDTDVQGIIPGNFTLSAWSLPQGDAGPAGGMYSSQSDLVKLGQAIMKNTQLSGDVVRRWMKPTAHTAVWQQSVGRPWEIARWPVEGRIVDVYTKFGDIGAYHSAFALMPDYGVGIVVMSAGAGGVDARAALLETVAATLLPGLEDTARSQAKTNIAGTFTSPTDALNSSITLETEPNLPGLKITSFISNSTDVLRTFYPVLYGHKNPDVRLYPSNLWQKTANDTMITAYHVVAQDPAAVYPSEQIEALNCVAWEMVDSLTYGATGADEFWIETDASGKAVSVQPKVFGVTLERA